MFRLGGTLKALRLQWYDARLAHLAGLPACLAGLPALQRLELPMTPGALLPALSSLARLTCLSVAAVGDVLHMQDLGVPRCATGAHQAQLQPTEQQSTFLLPSAPSRARPRGIVRTCVWPAASCGRAGSVEQSSAPPLPPRPSGLAHGGWRGRRARHEVRGGAALPLLLLLLAPQAH